MPLKLVARLPYWSSASTSKPNRGTGRQGAGRIGDHDQVRGGAGCDVDRVGRGRAQTGARHDSVTVPTWSSVRPEKFATPAAAVTVVVPFKACCFPESPRPPRSRCR